jgi:putative tricarboxylic transport membrane protein
MTYLNRAQGDGHSLLLTSASVLTSHIMGQASLSYTDMTPLAQLFHEYAVLVVNADSPIKDAKDFIARIKTAADSISIGVSSPGSHHHLSIARAAKGAGADPKRLKIVSFKSGTEALVATMGGHVDASVSSVSNILTALEAGTVRAIAVSAPQRLTGRMAKVTTWREVGLDSVSSNFRMLFGPHGLSEAQVAYWDQLLFEATSTEAWAKQVESNAWVAGFLKSAPTKKALAAEHDTLLIALSDLGLVKR